MCETTSRRHKLQTKFHKTQSNSRRCNSFTIISDSIDHKKISNGAKDTLRRLTRLVRRLGGQCDWPERRIVAHLEMARGTYRDHRRELEAAGEIELVRRRQFGCRLNDTNILRLGGEGLKIRPQKQVQEVLKTTTTAPERGGAKSALQKLWESRFAQDRRDSKWRREQYQAKARMWERCRNQSERVQRDASIGSAAWYERNDPRTEEQKKAELAEMADLLQRMESWGKD